MISSIELQVISRILTSDDSAEVNALCRFDASYYSVFTEQIQWILQHRQQYQTIPDVFTFQAEFPDITLVTVDEPLEFLTDQLKKNKSQIILLETFNKLKDLGSGDIYDAWQYLNLQCERAAQLSESRPLDIVHDAEKRAEQIIEFNQQKRIPTGFPEIDKLMYGGLSTVEELLLVVARTNSGKAQPLWAPVLTPTGWTTMGELKVGDVVVGKHNDNGKVVEIFPQGEKDYYQIHFDDGTYAECCDDHLWEVVDYDCRLHHYSPRYKVLTTGELRNSNKRYTVDISNAIQFDAIDNKLPISSIKLGEILGHPDEICNCNSEIQKQLIELGILQPDNTYQLFIPKTYLVASVADRSALFTGIMNTDLYQECKNIRGWQISTIHRQLAYDIAELVQSLGIKIHIESISGNKLDLIHIEDDSAYKTIQYIEYVGKTQCQCILLDNSSHTYITSGYTVTHNPWVLTRMMESAQEHGFPTLFYSPEMQAAFLGTRFDTWRQHFQNNQLYQGKYTDEYLQYLQELQKEETSAFILEDKDVSEGSVNVGVLRNLVREHHIKLLIIDGLSYMSDGANKSESDYIKYKNLCLELFKLSKQFGCAVVVSMQANRQTKENKDDKGEGLPSLYEIEGSDHPARIATQAFSIRQVFDKHVLDIRLEKSRMANNQKPILSYAWDVNTGNARYLPGDDSESGESFSGGGEVHVNPASVVNVSPAGSTSGGAESPSGLDDSDLLTM